MVTKAAVPSGSCNDRPRALVIVTTRPKQATRGGGAQRHDGCRFDEAPLHVEPHLAALDLMVVRPLVQAPFAAQLMFEVLHRIGHKDFGASNPGFRERLVKHASGGTNERLARDVFLVAGLLADQHQMRLPPPLPRHRLSSRRDRVGIACTRARPPPSHAKR